MGDWDSLVRAIQNMSYKDEGDLWELTSGNLYIYGDCIIEGKCPIKVLEHQLVICKGRNVEGTPKVVIRATEKHQPCIGHPTNTNLSYGRYEINSNSLDKIVVDGCDVYLESKTENFTIGTFGKQEVPEVEVWSGSFNCPEMFGTRVMKVTPEPLQGSTKHSRYAEYVIIGKGKTEQDYLSDEVLELKKEIFEINPKQTEYIKLITSVKNIKTALELLRINNKLDCYFLLSGKFEHVQTHILKTCCVLNLYNDCCVSSEMQHEINKWECLGVRNNLPKGVGLKELSKLIIEKISNGRRYDELTDFEKVMVYELIPIYLFDYADKSDDECAREWWSSLGFK